MAQTGRWAGLLAVGFLAACDPVPAVAPDIIPSAPMPETAAPVPASTLPSAESRALSAHYAAVDAGLRSRGLMRTDDGRRDAPFTAAMLADHFRRIALYDEYVNTGGVLEAHEVPSALRRWEQPVRIAMIHGATTPPARADADRAELASLVTRLSRATRHPIRTVETGANFTVLVLDEDERRGYAEALRRLVPGISRTDIDAITRLPQSTFCAVFAFSAGPGKPYSQALAVIRAEHPPGLRSLCLHEEVAQGLGLANDAPIRPSIFNDDEEFALLTMHDELLLRMLYDPRLHTGMTEAEARPVVDEIAQELTANSN